MSGSTTIGMGLIALFLVGIIYLALTPLISGIAEDPTLYKDVTDPSALFLRDNVMMIYYASGVMIFFIIIIWMFSAVTAKGAVTNFG